MNNNVYLVIMAGGVGSRFWPLSRESRPKQFLDILGVGKTFLQQTCERFVSLVPPENILVVTGENYRELVKEQLPQLDDSQILGEPLGRNTAPCIAYAAFRLRATDPDAIMIVTPADHFITGEAEFRAAITDGVEFAAARKAMVTIGITPTRPDTGYGYIQVAEGGSGDNCVGLSGSGQLVDREAVAGGSTSDCGPANIARVKTFTEKPSAEVARMFVESGEYFWNSGIFIWKTDVILDALAEHLSETYELFASEQQHFGTPTEADTVRRIYPETRNISIDFGVIEKADNVYVRRSSFGWSDMGTWRALYEYLPKNEQGNAVAGDGGVVAGGDSAFGTTVGENVRFKNSGGTLVSAPEGKMVVVNGLNDYIVVDTPDTLLVWPRGEEQEIKQVVNELRFTGP